MTLHGSKTTAGRNGKTGVKIGGRVVEIGGGLHRTSGGLLNRTITL